ncbi:MAG: hypothetical protein LUE29_05195 [Lachnospiraceae bacterium]|nr:hypothetical protein [Lachnospiraceae bacterium]
MKKYIYIMLSSTGTNFAKLIRLFGQQTYNHAAVSLDGSFERTYAFARPRHSSVFLGHLVRESLERYTLRKAEPVPVMILKIPVSGEEYAWVRQKIMQMLDNPEYMYNLFSVLTWPLLKGFPVDRAYTCIEFVAKLLQHCGYLQEGASCHYRPDDLAEELSQYIAYEGDVRGCMSGAYIDDEYFSHITAPLLYENVKSLLALIVRTAA